MSHRVVIVGGGFGGLYAAKVLGGSSVDVTVVDKRNFHLFQPLLYQIATGGLSPGEIASPLRAVLANCKNIRVITAEVTDIVPDLHKVILKDGEIPYDTLIIGTGVSHDYFGKSDWSKFAPGLKTIEDALEIRSRIFLAFETAERITDPALRNAWMTFVIVGGGPTGVELAGALAELSRHTLRNDFRSINPAEAQIILAEGGERILPAFPPELSAEAEKSLLKLGVTVRTKTLCTDICEDYVILNSNEKILAKTILWAAGVKASPLGQVIAGKTGAKLDRAGRVMVEPDLSIAGYPDIFVIGDLASTTHQTGKPLPGVAPVAMQQGRYVGRLIRKRLEEKTLPPFHYRDKGNLAVIGRNAAVAESGRLKMHGFLAWLAWVFIHIFYLIEFDNKILVLTQWAWNYFTRKRGARLITGEATLPVVRKEKSL